MESFVREKGLDKESLLELLKEWDKNEKKLDNEWEKERHSLELNSDLFSNRNNSFPDSEILTNKGQKLGLHCRTKSDMPIISKGFWIGQHILHKKTTSNGNSLMEEADEQSQVDNNASKQNFNPNVENDTEEHLIKNSGFLPKMLSSDNRRYSSEHKNSRAKGFGTNKLSFKEDLNKAEFIDEHSNENSSKNTHKAKLNFNQTESQSHKNLFGRKNIKDIHVIDKASPKRTINEFNEQCNENHDLSAEELPEKGSKQVCKEPDHKSSLLTLDISKNKNIINPNDPRLVFDITNVTTMQGIARNHNFDVFRNSTKDKESRFMKPSLEYENSNTKGLSQIGSGIKEKGKANEKKSPFPQKICELRNFPSLILDPFNSKDKFKRENDKRPYTMECIESTNKTENEGNSNIYSIKQEMALNQLDRIINLNTDIFDRTFTHEWQSFQKPIASKPLEIFPKQMRPSLSIMQSKIAHLDSVRKVEFVSEFSDKTFLMTISNDCLIKVWNFKYKSSQVDPSNTIPADSGRENRLKALIGGTIGKKINLGEHFNQKVADKKYTSASMSLTQVVRCHASPLFACCKSYSDNLPYRQSQGPLQFFTGDLEGNITCLRFGEKGLVPWRSYKGASEPVWALSFSHPGLLLASTPNKIKLFDISKLKSRNEEFSISTNKQFFGHLEFFTQENFIVNSFSSKTLKNEFLIFDLMKEKESSKMRSKQGPSNTFKSLAERELLISANENHSISLFDTREKEQSQSFVAHSNAVVSIDVSANRHTLVTAGCDSSVRMWDLRTLRCFSELSVHRTKYDDSIFDVKFDPTGAFVCTAGADSSVKIFQF